MNEEQVMSAEAEQAFRQELAGELWEGGKPVAMTDETTTHKDEQVRGDELNGQGSEAAGEQSGGSQPAALDVKAMLDGFLNDIDRRLKPLEGRVGAIQRDIQLQKNAAEQAAKQVSDAPSKEQMAKAAKDEDEWNQLREEFPEWAEALEKKTTGLREELKSEIDAIKSSAAPAGDIDSRLEKMRLDYEVKLLTIKHPDWRQKTASPEYQAWLAQQPDDVRDTALNSNDAMECIEILDKFDVSNKQGRSAAEIAEERQRRLKTSEGLPGGKVPLKTKNVDDMSVDELRRHLAKEIWSD